MALEIKIPVNIFQPFPHRGCQHRSRLQLSRRQARVDSPHLAHALQPPDQPRSCWGLARPTPLTAARSAWRDTNVEHVLTPSLIERGFTQFKVSGHLLHGLASMEQGKHARSELRWVSGNSETSTHSMIRARPFQSADSKKPGTPGLLICITQHKGSDESECIFDGTAELNSEPCATENCRLSGDFQPRVMKYPHQIRYAMNSY